MPNPPEIPVRDFPSPEILDGLIVETFDNNKGGYKPVPVGTRIPEGTDSIFAGYELVSQKTTGDFRWTQRFWVNQPSNQDLYNASLEYDGEDHAKPVYTRQYIERRPYTSRANGATLSGVLGVVVTNGGTGYDDQVPPAVSFTGGGGSGATAVALVYRGVVVYVRITNEGTGYATVPTVVFASGVAAGTAFIQSAGAVLVSEKLGKLPKDDPRFGLYDLVVREYRTLPGAWIPFTRYDDDLGPIQGQRRRVVNTGQVASLTSTLKTTYQAGPDDNAYAIWEIQELFGAGVSGFSAYPTLTGASQSEQVRGRIVGTSSTVVAHGTSPDTGSLVISSTVKDRNNQLADKTTVSFASLPPDEVVAFWDWVGLPLCVLDIVHTVYCNNGPFFTLVTNFDTAAGATVLRKHRRTTSYVSTAPDTTPNLSGSAFETADLQYQGKAFSFNLSNVLNDALSYSATFATASGGSACSWDEIYSYSATSPSATTFLAGAWYTKYFHAEPFGQSMWKIDKLEYYSAQGNPAI